MIDLGLKAKRKRKTTVRYMFFSPHLNISEIRMFVIIEGMTHFNWQHFFFHNGTVIIVLLDYINYKKNTKYQKKIFPNIMAMSLQIKNSLLEFPSWLSG